MKLASARSSGTAFCSRFNSVLISFSWLLRSSSCLFCVSSVRFVSLALLRSSFAFFASLRAGENTNSHQTAITPIAAKTVTVMVRLFISFPGSSLDVGLELLQPMASRRIGQVPARAERHGDSAVAGCERRLRHPHIGQRGEGRAVPDRLQPRGHVGVAATAHGEGDDALHT